MAVAHVDRRNRVVARRKRHGRRGGQEARDAGGGKEEVTPPTPVLLRQAAGLSKGAATAGRESVGTITDAQLAEIAQVKLKDLNTDDVEAAKRQMAGTARSMGIKVAG